MADILWPAALPQGPATFSQAKLPSATIRTNPDDGPAKMRRRFTKAVTQGSMSFTLRLDQWLLLEQFYEVTCNMGTQFFVFLHPWYQQNRKFRLTKPPSASANGPLAVDVSCDWELF